MEKLKKLKVYKKSIIEYSILFFVMLILSRSSVINLKIPFCAGFAFSLIYLNKNGFIVSTLYLLSSNIGGIVVENLVGSVSVISLLLFLYLSSKIFNKKPNFLTTIISCIIGHAGYVYYNIKTPQEIIITVVIISVVIMFLYICSQALGAIFNRGLQSRFTLDETICFSILTIVIFSGLGNLYLNYINLTQLICLFLILLVSRTFNLTILMYLSVLMGVGISLYSGDVTTIAVFAIYAIVLQLFRDKQKILSVLAIVIVDLLLGYFLNVYAFYSYINVCSVLAVCLIYFCIPDSFFIKIKGYSYNYEGSLTEEYLVYDQKMLLRKKLLKTAELFNEIQNAYRNLSVGELSKEKAAAALTEEILSKYCKKCGNYFNCIERSGVKESINQLFEFGIEKGKVSIIDANNLISTHCLGLNGLINETNNYLENYFLYKKEIKNDNDSKVIIAEQFLGTSNIFKELSEFIVGGEKINRKTSNILMDELTLNGIVVKETLVIESDKGVEKVVLIVRNTDVLSDKIKQSLHSIFNLNLSMQICQMTRFAGWSLMCFTPAPKYDISVGYATSSKENVSGDNFSFLKLNNNRVLIAICDGMGHGDRANKISNVALNLIESFYQSGFSSGTIISSVNKILLPAGEENFTTLDACVFNKNDATIDFIKIGASCSVIKSQETSKMVVHDSLPLGIVDKCGFCAKRYILKDKDIVVLASDGVVDSFNSMEEYVNFVNNERVINVQMLANNILEEAECRNMHHQDDKTVITFKVGAKV